MTTRFSAGNIVIRDNTVRSACYQFGKDAETAFDECEDITAYATAINGTHPTGTFSTHMHSLP